MEYVVMLCFDEHTESYFDDITKEIADGGASDYMADKKYPPHITIADFHTDDVGKIVNELDNNISGFAAGDVVWASLGAFVPRVLFASPVMNDYLLNACTNINRLLEPLVPHRGDGFYLPNQWVPHTTLASDLDKESLIKAFGIATEKFFAVKGKCVRLMLLQCRPYVEIKTWDLR